MAINGVPWAIGGGAVVDEGVARMLPYFMFAGTEGVLNNADCAVRATAVPSGTVRVLPGGYNVIGRGAGQLYEAYLNRLTTQEIVPIAPTAGAARSDLVILRIKDSHIAGSEWSDPPSLANGPYADAHVIQGVPNTTRKLSQLGNSWSAITLARIDIPANTATITDSMIVNLRTKVAAPAIPVPPITYTIIVDEDCPDNPENQAFNINRGPSTGSSDLTSASVNVWRVWPTQASWIMSIPRWANTMDIVCNVYNANVNGSVYGETRLEIGNAELYTPASIYDYNYTGGPGLETLALVTGAGSVEIPSTMRGKNKRVRLNARSLAVFSPHTGTISVARGCVLELRVIFKERCD